MDNPTAPIPSDPAQPAVPSPTASQNRPWFLWFAAGLAILILGVALGVFGVKFFNQFQNNPDCTARSDQRRIQSTPLVSTDNPEKDWYVYANPKLGIEFKTQEKFSVKSENDKSVTVIFKEEIIPIPLTVSKTRSIIPSSLADCSIPHDNFQSCIFNQETQDIKLDNNPATKYHVSFGGPDNDWVIIQTHDSSIEIKMYSYGLYEALDQILSTFKFLD